MNEDKKNAEEKLKKKIWLIGGGAILVLLILIGFFIQFFYVEHESDPDTKFVGLMDNTIGKEDTEITKEDQDIEENQKPVLSEQKADQIPAMVNQYLASADYVNLDSYLRNISDQYKDNTEGVGISKEQIAHIRADLVQMAGATPDNARLMFHSFSDPNTLVSAMIFSPISVKYNVVKNVDSFILPPPENVPVAFSEKDLTTEEKSAIMGPIIKNPANNCNDVKVFLVNIFDCDLEFVLTYSLVDNAWSPYLIDTKDPRGIAIFNTSQDFISMIDANLTTPENLDGLYQPQNLNEIEYERFGIDLEHPKRHKFNASDVRENMEIAKNESNDKITQSNKEVTPAPAESDCPDCQKNKI